MHEDESQSSTLLGRGFKSGITEKKTLPGKESEHRSRKFIASSKSWGGGHDGIRSVRRQAGSRFGKRFLTSMNVRSGRFWGRK